MNIFRSFLLLLSCLTTLSIHAQPEQVRTLLTQTPEIELIRFSLERVQAEQLQFLAKQKRFSQSRKITVATGVIASSVFLWWYLKSNQQPTEQMTKAQKADFELQVKLAFHNNVYPSFGHRCKRIVENAFIYPIIYFVINVLMSWGSQDFLPSLMSVLGSTEKEAKVSYEWFCQAAKNFILVAEKTEQVGNPLAQKESYQRAAVCAHNSLVLYSESFIAAILSQLQLVKPQHHTFKQEVVQAVQTMILALESLWKDKCLVMSKEVLHTILIAQELLCAQQQRIHLYV